MPWEAPMNDLPLALKTFLVDAAGRLRDAHLPERLAEGMGRLASEVEQPCVVAVVGRMKAGKSTFGGRSLFFRVLFRPLVRRGLA
jgi:hypothetical protein